VATKQPNIVAIMSDDVGIWNIGAYHRGMMAGRTPNLDKLASEGMLFTDYYAEASCTAGRAAFITAQLPIRTGMTTVGQAGAPLGLPALQLRSGRWDMQPKVRAMRAVSVALQSFAGQAASPPANVKPRLVPDVRGSRR
jgi:hypothetical protein